MHSHNAQPDVYLQHCDLLFLLHIQTTPTHTHTHTHTHTYTHTHIYTYTYCIVTFLASYTVYIL